jgi:hypothetical protein
MFCGTKFSEVSSGSFLALKTDKMKKALFSASIGPNKNRKISQDQLQHLKNGKFL